jgi:hypothetical protein
MPPCLGGLRDHSDMPRFPLVIGFCLATGCFAPKPTRVSTARLQALAQRADARVERDARGNVRSVVVRSKLAGALRGTLEGMGPGILAGGVLGTAMLAADTHWCSSSEDCDGLWALALTGVIGPVVGMVVGGTIGGATGADVLYVDR